MGSFYEALGVDRSASLAVIRKAYLLQLQLVHPDRHQGAPDSVLVEAERMTRALNEAWSILSDPQRRAAYDATLTGESRPAPPTNSSAGTGSDPTEQRSPNQQPGSEGPGSEGAQCDWSNRPPPPDGLTMLLYCPICKDRVVVASSATRAACSRCSTKFTFALCPNCKSNFSFLPLNRYVRCPTCHERFTNDSVEQKSPTNLGGY